MPEGMKPDVWGEIFPDDVKWMPFAAFPVRPAERAGRRHFQAWALCRPRAAASRRQTDAARASGGRIFTVISGVFYIGRGQEFDPEKLVAYPPGSVVILPGNTVHFHWAKSGEYVTQVNGIGPLGIDYFDAKDDPRSH